MSGNKYTAVGKFSLIILWVLAFSPAHSAIISYTNAAAYDTTVSWGEFFLDFEEKPLNTDISNQYEDLGVLFSAGNYGGALPRVVSGSNLSDSNPLGTRALRTYRTGSSPTYTFGMRMTFANPIRSLSGYHIDVGTNLLVEAFDFNANSLGSFSFAGGGESGDTARFFGLVSDQFDISFVELRTQAPFPGDLVGFDNLTFDQAAVPEPTTLALLSLGLFGLAARRRSVRGGPRGHQSKRLTGEGCSLQ